MLKIEGRTFMNIQEAVQWLLENNALPYQCTANYAPLTEIGLGTIVNPTPAKVRIGSLIFFADSKVSTVVGITDTGFICSDQYNNLVDDIVYVANVAINASGHLITTMSDGQTIDAGLIKQVSSFSINASQHLIVTYNDGTTSDLGAIFNGNITISGDLTVTGNINGVKLENIKDASGNYRFIEGLINPQPQAGLSMAFSKWSLSGTHLMIVIAGTVSAGNTASLSYKTAMYMPQFVMDKIFPIGSTNNIAFSKMVILKGSGYDREIEVLLIKSSPATLDLYHGGTIGDVSQNESFRVAFDLLIDNA